MQHYPLFLDLSGKNILIIGAGAVGQRKSASLIPCAPRTITIIDPELSSAAIQKLTASGPVICHARAFAPDDVHGKDLVFAATDRRDVNARVAALCRERGIFCNVADAPAESDFFVPAHFTSNGITLAVSTGGQSPALAGRLRAELEEWVGTRYSGLAALLGRLRPLLLALGLPTEENADIFRILVQSPLAELLESRQLEAIEALLLEQLPKPLHASIGELLHGF
ncbi:MAG: bifunctional precorrin-2 dehydrogenase/sirohydrochlorin ferrochelatase [Desulfovibrio sp.]|jgi:precorrin-2 dehydrogenase/sirohydrochlorin ferrochelatase|nr:bifunctional precorrin-2 dehydrogenase/sirohydrochlorin ferrochelatase [Desulfovibrio sp.]